jgi:pimeloyl-ACP methyl ester carboxylesterase
MPNPHKDWQDKWGPTSAPGLVLHPSDDPFGEEKMSGQVAQMLGARHVSLEGVGHWWPLQAPDSAVAALREFWQSI